jgi:hypothetical protein
MGMMTASQNKSVPNYYKRKDAIGSIADMIIGHYQDLQVYRQDVTEETLFPPEGKTHLQANTPHPTLYH